MWENLFDHKIKETFNLFLYKSDSLISFRNESLDHIKHNIDIPNNNSY